MLEIREGAHWPTATVDGPYGPVTVLFVGRDQQDRWTRNWYRKSRAYASDMTKKDANLAALHAALPAPKMRGEDPENDKAYADYNRAYVKAARKEVRAVLEALVQAGHLAEMPKTSFSVRAGCSCPCSPGFKLDVTIRLFDQPVDLSLS